MVGMTCGNPGSYNWSNWTMDFDRRSTRSLALVAQDSSHARRLRNQQPASLVRSFCDDRENAAAAI